MPLSTTCNPHRQHIDDMHVKRFGGLYTTMEALNYHAVARFLIAPGRTCSTLPLDTTLPMQSPLSMSKNPALTAKAQPQAWDVEEVRRRGTHEARQGGSTLRCRGLSSRAACRCEGVQWAR